MPALFSARWCAAASERGHGSAIIIGRCWRKGFWGGTESEALLSSMQLGLRLLEQADGDWTIWRCYITRYNCIQQILECHRAKWQPQHMSYTVIKRENPGYIIQRILLCCNVYHLVCYMTTKYVRQHIPTSGFQMAGLKVMTYQNFGITLEQINFWHKNFMFDSWDTVF